MRKPNHRALLTLSLAMLSVQLAGQSAQLPEERPAGATKGMLVVAPSVFHPALQEFVAHKQKLLPTELRSLESILQKTSGVDDPEKLKRFLYFEWKTNRLGYALLVGDV